MALAVVLVCTFSKRPLSELISAFGVMLFGFIFKLSMDSFSFSYLDDIHSLEFLDGI
jgi:hypothetical protein